MKIYLDNIIYNLQKSGGISVYWTELLNRLINDTSIDSVFIEYNCPCDNIFRKNIILSDKVIIKKYTFPSIKLARYRNIRLKTDQPSIFHSSYYRVAYGKNIKNIVTVHDFTYEMKMKGVKSKVHIYQKRKALYMASGIICISENTKIDLLKLYPKLSVKPIRVIYNGYDKNVFKYNDVIKKNQLLFVGSRVSYKNFAKAVEVVSKTSETILVVVGSPLSAQELKMLNDLIPNRYKLETYISSEKLNVLYSESLALLYLSDYEGFGIPILEAMSSGCPVIALNTSSIPEVAGKAGILLDRLNIDEIVGHVNKLYFDKGYMEDVVCKGLTNVVDFSWDKCYSEMQDFYKEIIIE